MRYMSFIRHTEKYRKDGPPAAQMQAMGPYVEKSMKEGTVVEVGGLLASDAGARVRLSKGEITVTDGPFTESKEVIGGWAVLEARSRAHAIELARDFMELHRTHWPEFEGECEVREMFNPGEGP